MKLPAALKRKALHIFTCLVALILCVMLILVTDTAEKNGGLRVDLSFNAITTSFPPAARISS